MADFYPILARAVAGLPDNTPEARRAIFDRARAALVAQLRGLDPPLSEAEIMRERLTLDEAVARIEAEYDESPAPQPGARGPLIRPQADAAQPPRPPEPKAQTAFAPLPRDGEAQEPGEDGADADFDASLTEAAESQPARPRILPPREPRVKPGHIRTVVVGAVVALAVAAIAGTAIYVHKLKPQDAPRANAETATVQQPPQSDNAGKIADRVGEPNAPAQGRPGGSNTPGTPVQQPGGEIAVAQRAILYVENPDNPQQPRAVTGRVFWRLDSESAGQGRPVETIVRATVEIPEAGLNLDFTIRRNTDSAFPASHIVGMRFVGSGDATQTIKEVGVPQFKTAEGERGAPLSAINSALGDNLFVAALSNVPVEVERNTDLILNRSWIDLPVLFTSGRRGIITFEKGVSGAQTLGDAFGRWQ
ncbi:histidine kinase [Bosea sp. (in: a-proteobacteria)]